MFSVILTYAAIFFAKLFEVSLATLRNVLINRGEKLQGALIGFVEVMIWVLVVNKVLTGLSNDPLLLVVYCLAFSCGNYLGVMIESKLAIGNASIQVIVSEERREEICSTLRQKGFGITVIDGRGKDGQVVLLIIFLKRKRVNEASEIIKQFSPNAIVVVNDVRQLKNGYVVK